MCHSKKIKKSTRVLEVPEVPVENLADECVY